MQELNQEINKGTAEMPDRCTVEKCGKERQIGDLLFCFVHRGRWVELCKRIGIDEKNFVSEDTVEEYLNKFQNKMI